MLEESPCYLTDSLPVPKVDILIRLKKLLFGGGADVSTSEGRSADRYHRALLTTAVSAASKIVTVSAALISIPLTLRYLGAESYGLWMTISSFVACLTFADLGVGNGLLNGISKAKGLDDHTLGKQYVSSAFFFLTTVAFGLGAIFALLYRFVPWPKVFGVTTSQASSEAGPAMAVLTCCLLASIPIGIVTKVQAGYQEGFRANLWQLLGNVMSFGALLIVVSLRGSLSQLILAVSGIPLIALLANSGFFFLKERPYLIPSLSHVKRAISKDLLRSGFLFVVLQLCAAISFSSDNMVVAQILGSKAVAEYAISAKLFSVATLPTMFAISALWPAFAEALVRRDLKWVKKSLVRSSVLLVATATVVSALLLAFAPAILKAWVGSAVRPRWPLLLGLASWSIVLAASGPLSVLLNAATVIRLQLFIAVLGTCGNITASIFLTRSIGISGAIWGSVISQIVLVLIPYAFYMRNFFNKLEKQN